MTAWRTCRALQTFIAQCNDAWPHRSKAHDGTIGDTTHQAETSGHNPDATGVVVAFDLTHDPAHGVDCNEIVEDLRGSRDRRIKYLIWNRYICRSYAKGSVKAWAWAPYTGPSPHTDHLHLSVGADTRPWEGSHGYPHVYDDPAPWTAIGGDDVTEAQLEATMIKVLTTSKIVPIPGEAHPAAGEKATVVQALTQDWGHTLRDENLDRQG